MYIYIYDVKIDRTVFDLLLCINHGSLRKPQNPVSPSPKSASAEEPLHGPARHASLSQQCFPQMASERRATTQSGGSG